MPLKDVICPAPRILFVGINPGLRSEALGHHFAGPGNPFWRLLFAAGLTPRELTYAEDQHLAEFGLALTNLCPRASRAAAELSKAELEEGRALLTEKILRLRPKIVAFVGITIYQSFFAHKRSSGPGEKPETIADAAVFVLPNPSGLNASFPGFAHKLVWYKKLRRFEQRIAI